MKEVFVFIGKIRIELAPVSAKRCRKLSLSSYPECGQLQMTVFVFLLVEPNFYTIFFFATYGDGLSACFSPCSSFLDDLIWMIRNSLTLIMVICVSEEMKRLALL